MLLFKPEHVDAILDGTKTETRRIWKKNHANVGATHKCYTRPPWMKEEPKPDPFAAIEITRRWQEKLGAITQDGAVAEGYSSVAEYFAAFARINDLEEGAELNLDLEVECVEFRLVAKWDSEMKRLEPVS